MDLAEPHEPTSRLGGGTPVRNESRMYEFTPYVFPLGRRLDGRLAERGTDVRVLVVPSLDVEERADAYVVTAIVPGASKDEIEVSFEAGVVRVAGEMPWTETREVDRMRGDAQCFRTFSREVPLARPVDVERAEATFEDGVLTAHLPFADSERSKERAGGMLRVT
jgi:HSP20 family protein